MDQLGRSDSILLLDHHPFLFRRLRATLCSFRNNHHLDLAVILHEVIPLHFPSIPQNLPEGGEILRIGFPQVPLSTIPKELDLYN